MKNVILLLFLVIAVRVVSQVIPNPDFPNRVYGYQAESGYKSLERVSAKIAQIQKNTWYLIDNVNSNVKFNLLTIPKFIIKMDEGKDPADYVKLGLTIENKNQRNIYLGGIKSEKYKDLKIKLEFKKIGDGLARAISPLL